MLLESLVVDDDQRVMQAARGSLKRKYASG